MSLSEGKEFNQDHTELVPQLWQESDSLSPQAHFLYLPTGFSLKRLWGEHAVNTIPVSPAIAMKVVLMCCPLMQYQSMLSSFQKKESTQASLMVMPAGHQLIPQEALASQL